MVQGLTKAEAYLDKGQGDGDRRKADKNINDVRERPRIKLKIFLSSTILITSIFVFTGTIIFLNLNPRDNCWRGCINVHIIPYMRSSLNRMIYLKDFNGNAMDDSFDYVVDELEKDERRRFTITEIYPFWNWWKNQTDLIKLSVRSLINEGRIEIAGGGWCIPDEAIVHYRSFVDQFTWGLRRLEEIAGKKISPNVSFLMDNRGHSKEIASLLKEMDFRGVMLGGISPMEQRYRQTFLKMEFLWSDKDIFGVRHEKPNLFTSILDERLLKLNEYFSYENPIIDLNEFFNGVVCQSQGYTTNNVFVPIGGNFKFSQRKNAFDVIESIIKLTKLTSKYRLNVDYSTPSIYLNSIDYSNERWMASKGEFLPYLEGNRDYWTGYYSLRSSFKYVQRLADRYLQILKQMMTLSNVQAFEYALIKLRESVGLSQHHSAAISSQSVAHHFHDSLIKSMEETGDAIDHILGKLTVKGNYGSKLRYESCLKLNLSECSVTEKSEAFVVTVYNPSSRIANQYVRVPVTGNGYLVRTGDGQSLTTQIVHLSSRIRTMPDRKSKSGNELIFRATKIPPLGFKSYYVSAINETSSKTAKKRINLILNESTGTVSAIERSGKIYPISQELKLYKSLFSNSVAFRPTNEAQSITRNVSIRLLNDGELLTEYEQTFGSWASQMIRIYQDQNFVEYRWIVSHVPISLFESKEIVSSFSTNIRNGCTFYLDSNGRGFQQNVNGPETDNESIGESIAKNYRPINSRIGIADQDSQLHVFNDRVQGGSSPFQGQIEIMVHRELANLAILGKNDKSNEESENFETGQHWVFVGSSEDSDFKSNIEEFSSSVGWEPWQFFADASNVSFEEWRDNHLTEFFGLKRQLPKNLRVLTLEPWTEDQILVRLENIGNDDNSKVLLNLQELFSGLVVKNATEVSLTGNDFKKPCKQESKIEFNSRVGHGHGDGIADINVFIYSSRIKTFILSVNPLH